MKTCCRSFVSLALLNLVVIALCAPTVAQEVPPALMVKIDGKSQQLGLTRLDYKVRIYGHLAETTATMTFANSLDRVMEGDLYFPLPEGASVSGYALDIEGKMVPGVAVEKDKGRRVFEKIVRQGIDPGLVEWTKGNKFKTRVFPIPAKGTRTIRVQYVSTLVSSASNQPTLYRLPLNHKQKIEEFSLSIEVIKPSAVPTIAQGELANFSFAKWEDNFKAETQLKDTSLTNDLVIALPDVERANVMVEKSEDGTVYFAIHDLPKIPSTKRVTKKPERVVVYWDASLSREGKQREREIELLSRCLSSLLPKKSKSQGFDVELVVFRNTAEKAKTFQWSNLNVGPSPSNHPLPKYLRELTYDGGTQLASISRESNAPNADLYLVFTDGLSNFGQAETGELQAPVYVFSADTIANHISLRQLATITGGRYFNLNRTTDDDVMSLFNRPVYSYLGTANNETASDIYPRMPQPVAGRFTLVGKLTGDESTLAIDYGFAGQSFDQNEFAISAAAPPQGELLKRLWAQTKLAELMISQEENESEIVALGKLHSMVTPYTSLIVLDSIEQYVDNDIPPPRSLPKLLDEYNRRIDTLEVQQRKQKRDKLEAVVAMWEQRVEWWEKEFKYPKNFRYKEEKAKNATGEDAAEEEPTAEAPAFIAPGELAESEDALDMSVEGGGGGLGGALPEPQTAAPDSRNSDGQEESKKEAEASRQPGIAIKEWDPKTPYLKELRAAKNPTSAFAIYLKNRTKFGESPAYYLDCAEYFQKQDPELALQILSNIAELGLDSPQLLRVLGHRLVQLGEFDLAIGIFEEAKRLRPEEPQSYRDLALALIRRADEQRTAMQSMRLTEEAYNRMRQSLKDDYARSLLLLNEVVLGHWDRFNEIEVIALIEANRIIPRAKELGASIPIDKRLVKQLDCDVRISMSWHADMTDIDLHVIEPSSEEAYYSHNRTTIGGLVSRDFTQGYGPEEYVLRRAMNGTYTIKAKYYGSNSTRLLGDITIQLDIFTNYGRDNEQRRSITRRLKEVDEMIEIGQLEF